MDIELRGAPTITLTPQPKTALVDHARAQGTCASVIIRELWVWRGLLKIPEGYGCYWFREYAEKGWLIVLENDRRDGI